MKNKKLFSTFTLLSALVLIFSFTSCSKSSNNRNTEENNSSENTEGISISSSSNNNISKSISSQEIIGKYFLKQFRDESGVTPFDQEEYFNDQGYYYTLEFLSGQKFKIFPEESEQGTYVLNDNIILFDSIDQIHMRGTINGNSIIVSKDGRSRVFEKM